MRAAHLPLIAATLLTLTPAVARADDPDRIAIRLSYIRGPGAKNCPPEQTLHDEVARRMGYDPFTADAPDRIVATQKRSAGKLTATVERFDSKDIPQWEPQRYEYGVCVELVRAMAIYISEMFRPHVVLSLDAAPLRSPPAGASSAEPPPPPKVELPPLPAPILPKVELPPPRYESLRLPLPPSPRRWAGHIAASSGVGFGVAPADVAAMVSLEGGAQWRLTPGWILSGSFGVLYSPRVFKSMPLEMSGAEVEVGTTLATSVLSPCLHRHVLFGWVFGCVGLELGGLRGDGAQIPYPASAVTLWAAIDPRLGIEVPVASLLLRHFSQLSLRMFGDLPVPLHHPKVLVGEGPSMIAGRVTQVWVTPPVAGAISLGLVTRFDP